MSKGFPIDVGVCQGSALSPLLSILIMEEATKECQCEALWHLLFADDLVLSAESKEAVEVKFMVWNSPLESRGSKVNIGEYFGVYGLGIGANSILCSSFQNWCHKLCSGLRVLREDPNFTYQSCSKNNAPLQ